MQNTGVMFMFPEDRKCNNPGTDHVPVVVSLQQKNMLCAYFGIYGRQKYFSHEACNVIILRPSPDGEKDATFKTTYGAENVRDTYNREQHNKVNNTNFLPNCVLSTSGYLLIARNPSEIQRNPV